MIYDSGKESIKLDLNDIPHATRVSKAIASEVRLTILKLLVTRAMTITELAEALMLPLSSVSMHTKLLKEAKLISIIAKPGKRGIQKLCGIKSATVDLDIFRHVAQRSGKAEKRVHIPIGSYALCDVDSPCGLCSASAFIGREDSIHSFYLSDKSEASLIWFSSGYLEYHISNHVLLADQPHEIELSFEICSEAPGYNHDWPSDIAIDINGKRIAAMRLEGDYGDRKGMQNPYWWSDGNTQYGEYHRIAISHVGVSVDGVLISRETIESLKMTEKAYFSFRIYTDTNSDCIGGINLFGRSFGDYPQDILMKVTYA
ncbi:MAG: helix-turn-helix domain-containing protein [Eubacteriales bacterium]|nr:helix-turn-helix domain-containing protein [Eubacteriales bacterium]